MPLLLALLGCPGTTGDTSAPDCYAEAPAVHIGTGSATFEPLGPEAVMVHGPQGGWHVLTSVRVDHTSEFVRIRLDIEDQASGILVAQNLYNVALVTDQACSGYFPGMFAFLDVSELVDGDLDTPPELLDGHVLSLSVTITDDAGRTASSAATVTAVRDEVDRE